MRKIIFNILTLSFFLTSCFSFKTDEEISHENIERIISVINIQDNFSFIELFSEKARQTDNFLNNVTFFFDFFIETINEYYDGGTVTERDKDGDYESKFQEMSYRLLGENEVYDIAIRWCIYWTPDDSNKTNYGIWSLYLINEKDNPEPQYSYRGDGLWTLGINLGVLPNENEV